MAHVHVCHHLWILCCWTSLWLIGAFHVSAIGDYCVKEANIICVANCVERPELPLFPESLSDLINNNCVPQEATTEQLATNGMETDQTSPTNTEDPCSTDGPCPPPDEPCPTDGPCPPEPPLPIIVIVLIVFGSAAVVFVGTSATYVILRKKHHTCKIHHRGESDGSSSPKPLTPMPPHGKNTVQKYHEDGTIVLEPVADSLNHPSCHASYAPSSNSSGQLGPTSSSPSGGKVMNTDHVPDPAEAKDERNRTFSTASRTGDTAVLMQTGNQGTSQPEEEPTKRRKRKKKRGSKNVELGQLNPKGGPSNEVKSIEEQV